MRAPVPWARPGSAPRPFRRRPVRVPGTTEPGGPLALGQICRFARARPRACFACVWAGRSRRCVVASLAARNRASARPSRPAWPGSGPGRDFFIRSRPEPGSGLARSRPGPAGSGPGRPMRWQSTSSCSPVSPSDILTPSVRLGGDSERTAWGATRRADGRRRLAAPARDYANGRTGQAVRSRQTDIIPNALGIIIQCIGDNHPIHNPQCIGDYDEVFGRDLPPRPFSPFPFPRSQFAGAGPRHRARGPGDPAEPAAAIKPRGGPRA